MARAKFSRILHKEILSTIMTFINRKIRKFNQAIDVICRLNHINLKTLRMLLKSVHNLRAYNKNIVAIRNKEIHNQEIIEDEKLQALISNASNNLQVRAQIPPL